ncbi:flagellar basal body-associated protein FliL [Qipengyuania sp.]|uniref:flagellar basal body-associated FliL family protein n=1 Tax=Qipengyuania sp. TaxID=2004515 RepID=UPI0035C7F3A4
MSDKPDKTEGGKKKKGGLMKIVILAVVVVGGAGGGAYGLAASGIVGGSHEVEEDHEPKLILKGGEDPYAPVAKEGEGEGVQFVHGEGGDKYRVAYYTFADEFTSNLRDSDALVQMTLAASTRRDGRVLMWLKEHELAIRSQLLVDLADTDELDLVSPAGKERLQKRLTKSINDVLEDNEGFGGVDQVYFRTLIVQ